VPDHATTDGHCFRWNLQIHPGNQGKQRLQGCCDSYGDFTQSIYSTGDDIAWDYGSDSRGGSRHDQVTGPKGNRSRNKSDNIRDWPYQFSDIRVLLDRSIDRKPDTARAYVADLAFSMKGRTRSRQVESFSPIPRPALIAGFKLKITTCQIYPNSVTPNMVQCGISRNIAPTGGNRHYELYFILKIASLWRVRNLRTAVDDRVRGLCEEKRRFTIWISPHLPSVRRIVAAYTKDPTDRETYLFA